MKRTITISSNQRDIGVEENEADSITISINFDEPSITLKIDEAYQVLKALRLIYEEGAKMTVGQLEKALNKIKDKKLPLKFYDPKTGKYHDIVSSQIRTIIRANSFNGDIDDSFYQIEGKEKQ